MKAKPPLTPESIASLQKAHKQAVELKSYLKTCADCGLEITDAEAVLANQLQTIEQLLTHFSTPDI